MVFGGITSILFNQEFGNTTTLIVTHIIGLCCVFIFILKFDWLKETGISRFGGYKIWLLDIIGTFYMALVSLYSFFGRFFFDFSNLKEISATLDIIMTQFAVSLNEEIFKV